VAFRMFFNLVTTVKTIDHVGYPIGLYTNSIANKLIAIFTRKMDIEKFQIAGVTFEIAQVHSLPFPMHYHLFMKF